MTPREIATELADAWDTLLRAERTTPAIQQTARYRMAEAVAVAVGELDPAHFHDPDPERLLGALRENAEIEARLQLVAPMPKHDAVLHMADGPRRMGLVFGCGACEWTGAIEARDRIEAAKP